VTATLSAHPTLAAARPAWEALEGMTANPFASWEYAEVWWRHLGRERPLYLCSEPGALFPLFESAPATLRFVGHVDADLLGPICAPADRDAAMRALARIAGGRRLIADDVPAGSHIALGGTLIERTASPVTALPAGFDDLLAAVSANHRAQVRARDRRLQAHGRVRVREADERTLERDLETLFALHRAHWTHERSRVFEGRRVAFHREWAAIGLRRGWLRLRILEVDGRPVAANHALRVGDVEWYYQAGRDPAWSRWSVGAVLQARCIAAAIDEGAVEYRWLRGDERYKRRWPTRDEPVETVLVDAR